jgi:glycosyltransferase involved in cell wall biosynthesis
MQYVKLMPAHSLAPASRNRRELSAAQEYGFEITVISSDLPEIIQGINPKYCAVSDQVTKLDNSMLRLKRYWIIIRDMFLLSRRTAKLQADILSCHDLSGLLIGWLSTWFVSKQKRIKLIYDSHEFELGRNTKRNRLQFLAIKHLEGFLMKRCAFSIMVNDSIADEVQRIHRLKQRPIVVRSTPENWVLAPENCRKTRQNLLTQMNLPMDTFLLMFHGNLAFGNGIEALFPVLQRNPHIGLMLLGNSTKPYEEKLNALMEQYDVTRRVLLKPAVPILELWKYVGAADLEIMTIEPIVKSHYWVLPNKFFESIQGLVPIVASDLPEMKGLIDRYQIGLTCPPNDIDAISACVERMRTDKAFYARCKENLRVAKRDLCWENEKGKLIEAYHTYCQLDGTITP